MSIDLTGKTKLTSIDSDFGFVVVDTTEATASDKAKRVAPEAVGQRALLQTRTVSGTTATLGDTDNNTIVRFTSATDVTVTLDENNPVGWSCMWVQEGAGQLLFVVEAGGSSIEHYQGHDASSGTQWSTGSLVVLANSGGDTATFLLSGVTAAA